MSTFTQPIRVSVVNSSREILARCKIWSTNNMAEGPCFSCKSTTKYSCINCSSFVCNRIGCSLAELDESTAGWIAQQSVGYCKSCADEVILDYQQGSKKSRAESDEQIDHSEGTSSGESDNSDIPLSHTRKSSQKLRGKGKGKKAAGRKAVWKERHIDDMIDIIVNDENFSRKLIFTNVKKQKNSEVYNKIFEHLKERYSQYNPPSSFPFTIEQMRTKFKWCVATCKRISLTISTKSGIKRIQDEKGYGQWFGLLYPLIKSRDSCQPEQSIEPDSLNDISGSDESSSLSREPTPPMFVPMKNHVKEKKKDLNEAIAGTLEVMKKAIENNPTKDILDLMRDDMKQAREQDLRFQQLIGTILQQQVLSNQPAQPWPAYGYSAPGYVPVHNQFDSANGQMCGTPVAPMQNYPPNTFPQQNPSTSENNFSGYVNYQQPGPN